MTAPWRRTDVDDVAGQNRKRVRSLEANCCTEDGVFFNPIYNGHDVYPQGPIHTTGATDPSLDDYFVQQLGYVTGNYVATCSFYIKASVTSYGPGDGDYYLTLPYDGGQEQYLIDAGGFIVGFPALGMAYCYDDSADDYFPMMLRLSETVTIDGGPALEAFDPTTGTVWSATFPFAWGANDVLLAGTFSYFLYKSLLDPAP